LRRFRGFHHEIARDLDASSRVRQIIHHDNRERVGNIQRDIALLFDGGGNIHAMFLQSLKKTLPM
jgi:hypothetical protein